MTKTKSSGEQHLRKNGGRGSQSSESKQGKKSKSKKGKQPAKSSESNDAQEVAAKKPAKIGLAASPMNGDSPKREQEFGSAEGMALEADIEGGDYVRGRELVREMEDSAIMKFQSEEDYQRELGPSNLERLSIGGRNYPDHEMLSGDANHRFSGEPNPHDNSSFERAESSDDFVPVEALNNPELAKLLQQRVTSGVPQLGPDPNYSRGRMAPTVVVENEALKQKLKLNLPKVKATDGYHEEFMKHFEEFSPSWRDSLMKEKNSKYY